MAMKVLIAGGGVAGLTASLALARAGHVVTVVEKAPGMGWGQGVQVSPPAMALLDDLGVADAVQETGQVMARSRKLTPDGLLLRERRFGDVGDSGQPHVAISRGALQLVLADAAKARGVTVELGTGLDRFSDQGDRVEVTLNREGQHDTRAVDLLLGADGIHSAARAGLFPGESPVYTGFIQYRGVVKAAEAGVAVEPGLVTVYGNGSRFYSFYLMNAEEISFGACVHVGEDQEPTESWSSKGDPEELLHQFHGFRGPLPELAMAIPYLARMHIFDHATLPHWSGERVTLLGDAAHALLPFAGQATVTAIEDAHHLAACLKDTSVVPDALRRYQADRIPHVGRIREHCRERGGIFEEYLVAETLQDAQWEALGRAERQARFDAVDWTHHDSFLRELY